MGGDGLGERGGEVKVRGEEGELATNDVSLAAEPNNNESQKTASFSRPGRGE